MSNNEESTDVLDPGDRGGRVRRKILEIIANNPRVIISDTADSLRESEIAAPPGENRTGDHVDKLVDEGLVNKHIDGNKRPLTLTDEGEEKCREIGISLPADLAEEFIEELNDLLAPGNLDSEKRGKLRNVLSEEVLETASRISNMYHLANDSLSMDLFEDGAGELRVDVPSILKGAWIFEKQRSEAQSSQQKFEDVAGEGENFEKETIALTIAGEREHQSELDELCEILQSISLKNPDLSKFCNSVKQAYAQKAEKREASGKETEMSPQEFELRKNHSRDLKLELESLKEWIQDIDPEIDTDTEPELKGRLPDEEARLYDLYYTGNPWEFDHLESHVAELMNRIENFAKKLDKKNKLNRRLLNMFSGDSGNRERYVLAVERCVKRETPPGDADIPVGTLKRCLRKMEVDVEEAVGSLLFRGDVEKFEEESRELVKLKNELQKEQEKITKGIEEILKSPLLPKKCGFIKKQLQT